MFRSRIHPSPAGTCPEGELFSSWVISIEETPNPEPPVSLTEHGSFTFARRPPQCYPLNVFHQQTGTLICSVVKKMWRLSTSRSYPHLPPPTATLPPLLFTDTAVQCQCVTSQTYRQSTPKQRKKEGRGECIPYVLRSPCPHLLPLFSWAVVGG